METEPLNNSPKIKFGINFEDDLVYTLQRLKMKDPAGLTYRLSHSDMDKSVVEAILNTDDEQKRKEVFGDYLRDYYKEHRPQMEENAAKYQEIWDRIGPDFFNTVDQITGPFDWKFSEYFFLVSSFYSRAAWGKDNHLAVRYSRNPETFYHMNAYEMILAHHFEIVDQIYEDKRPVSDWKIWALAEISAWFIVYKDSPLHNKLWPKLKEPDNFSYPQLLKPMQDLYPIFRDAKNYREYVEKSIEYIKGYTEEQLRTPVSQ